MSSKKAPESKRKFKYLPLTLSIGTLGGIATPLVLRGTPLPAKRGYVFSTASDNQEAVEIEVVMGERPIAKRNLEIGTFYLKGITKAPRGVPQIAVTFEVDQECRVKVNALEKDSGLQISVESEGAQPHLSEHDIRQLLQQAEESRSEDEKVLKLAEARTRAEALIHRADSLTRTSRSRSSKHTG